MSYYTAITIIVWLTLAALGVLIYKNSRIAHAGKRLLYLTYVLIAVSALAEWCGVRLDGRADLPVWMLRVVKCADYILTPMAGGALVVQMNLRNRWQKAMMVILGANAVFQVAAACAGGWMIVIDGQNHYTHGPLFPVYLGVCFAIYALVALQFTIYGRSYKRQNRSSLYAVMLLVMAGIGLQELFPGIRTAYLGMTIGASLMFIHYTEFSQMSVDSYIAEQRAEMQTDPLTGLLNRYAYSLALNEYAAGTLPEGFTAYTIDVNDLKEVNDNRGHEAGDELIRGAAECIKQVFRSSSSCYRTGGDEFVILDPDSDAERADADIKKLREETTKWHAAHGQQLSLAVGYALAGDNPGINAEQLVRQSDLAMYSDKADYYRTSGRERRRQR